MSVKRVFDAVDKAPFSGKFLIRKTTVDYVIAGEREKNKRYLKAAAVLGGMALVHAYQAKIGMDSFVPHAQAAVEHGETKDAVWTGYDALYSFAMSGGGSSTGFTAAKNKQQTY